MRPMVVRGLQRVDQMFVLTMTAYDPTRMRTWRQICLPAIRQTKRVKNGQGNRRNQLKTAPESQKRGCVGK